MAVFPRKFTVTSNVNFCSSANQQTGISSGTNVELTAAGKYSKQCNFFSTQVKQNTTNYIVVSFFFTFKKEKRV